jgi:aspartate aminotransferase
LDLLAVLVNTPANPTGAVFSRDDLAAIRDLAVDHDVWVIADEIYEKLRYTTDHISMASLEGMANRTVTINGFSKSHAMTGWRLGYYTAPDNLLEQAKKIQSHTVTCATSFAQYGALAALQGPQEPVEALRQTFEVRRNAAIEKLREEGLQIKCPDGAFYLFVPVAADDDVALCESLLAEEGVAVTPGSAFGVSGYIRISYANSEQRVLNGIDRLAEHLASV